MDLSVLALVLIAAAGHAAWNAWLKDRNADLAGFTSLAIGWLLAGIVGAVFTGFPAWQSVPFLLATTVIHTFYVLVLIKAYQGADFSLAYPIARGSAPLFVALLAPHLLNESLEGPSQFAVTLIVVGILMIGIFRARGSLGGRREIFLSLVTGMLIAGYTLVDAQGARSGDSAHAYAAWLFILTGVALIVLARVRLGSQLVTKLRARSLQHLWPGVLAGLVSVVAYWIVLWAMTVAPAALVAAARETSILFAALISWGFLGERITAMRLLGMGITVVGLILAKL